MTSLQRKHIKGFYGLDLAGFPNAAWWIVHLGQHEKDLDAGAMPGDLCVCVPRVWETMPEPKEDNFRCAAIFPRHVRHYFKLRGV